MRAHKTKRGYYEASVEFAPDPATGKRRRKRIFAKTPAELRERVAEAEEQRARGLEPIDVTVASFLLDTFLPLIKTLRRPATYRQYEMDTRVHILPTLPRRGEFSIKALTLPHVQAIIDAAVAAGLAARPVRNVRATLRRALNIAKARHLVMENVAEYVELPTPRKPKIRPFTREEAIRFLEAVRESRFEALYWMGLLLGLREGELLGLRLSSIDLDAGTLHICEGMQRVKQDDGSSKLVWIPTKSENADRLLPLPAVLIPILRAHLERLADERRTEGWEEHDLLFPSVRGTPKEASNLLRHDFKPALVRAGLGVVERNDKHDRAYKTSTIRFHDLRHTAASRWIADGGDLRSVSEALGHSSAAFTLATYAHAFDAQRRAMIESSAASYIADRVVELPERVEQVGDTNGDTLPQ